MPQSENVKTGIAGWLILPAIGCVLRPPLSAINIFRQFQYMSSSRYETHASQFPGLRLLSGFELFGKLAMLILICFVAYWFFKKRSGAPRAIITYMLLALGFAGARFAWGLGVFGTSDDAVVISLLRSSNIIGIAVACAIWVPYFRLSKRVRATFVASRSVPQPG